MGSFSRRTTIYRQVEEVWSALADIGSIANWHPGVVSSSRTTEQSHGKGAARHCDLGGGHYLEEEVVHWEDTRALTMQIVDTDLPFANADIRFILQPTEAARTPATEVTVSPVYRLRYGAIGRLLDVLLIRRQYARGMETLLAGLKRYVEGA